MSYREQWAHQRNASLESRAQQYLWTIRRSIHREYYTCICVVYTVSRLNVGIRYGVGVFVGHTHLSAVFGEPHLFEGMFPPSWESPVNQDQEQLCLVTPPLPLPFEQN